MSTSESIYELLTNEDDTSGCDTLADSACRAAPRSFVLLLASYCLTKLGDAIASPKTTLAWLISAVGAPSFMLGFIVPIRESGSMIPQLFTGPVIRQRPLRKTVWVAGSLGQALCVAGLAYTALELTGRAAGWAILALVALFSVCRSLCSVAAKDVLGKTIPKPRRGQLTGWASSIAGLLSVGVGTAIFLSVGDRFSQASLAALLLGAAVLWAVAAVVYFRVPEQPGETDTGRQNTGSPFADLGLLKHDKPFRNFVVTRALLMCSALSGPFYVALAQEQMGSSGRVLGAFVIAAGAAGLISGPIWGRLADASSKNTMRAAGLVTALIGCCVAMVSVQAPGALRAPWFLPLAFFVLSIAHGGVRVGRKTYVVNLAEGNRRTQYVAVSNTVIGLLLLIAGLVGALAESRGYASAIGLLSLMGIAGALYATRLPEVE